MRGKPRVWPLQVAIILGLLLVWEAIARFGLLDPGVFSPASAVLANAAHLAHQPEVLAGFGSSLWRILIAFLIAAVTGIGLGLLVGGNALLRDFSEPFVFTTYAIPKVAVFPLFLLWFGLGAENKIAFAAFHGFFPIIINTLAGVRQTQGSYLRVARSLGATRWQVYTKIVVPAMIPTLFTGLRLGLGLTILGEVLAELFVISGGIGGLINEANSLVLITDFFSLVLLVGIMATVINQGFLWLERRASRWRVADGR